MMQRISKIANTTEDLMLAYRVFDKDDNDCVPFSELRFVFSQLDGLSCIEINEIIKYFDDDSDGKMSFGDTV